MNFLILSVTAGEGHNSTARAIKSEFESKGAYCTVLDTFDYVSPELAKIISEGYLLITERAKYAYQLGYDLAEKRRASHKTPLKLLNYAMAGDLAAYINSDTFDAVIFTHPFAGILLDVMKQKKLINVRTIGILTDFTFHPYWENCPGNDYVITPDKLLTPQGLRKGFREEQIIPLGIPINPKFATRIDKCEARAKLGLDADKPVLLLMGGSMGYGNLGENVLKIDMLSRDFQLICVCGNNAEMKADVEKIAKTARHKILVTGFVDYISLIMDASDCIITKPGGLTTSESLAKGLPMIIINPIPGQEMRNAQFLSNTGCALTATKTCPLDECIYQLFESESRLRVMAESIKEIAKPNSAKNVCEFIMTTALTPFIGDSDGQDSHDSGENEGKKSFILFDID